MTSNLELIAKLESVVAELEERHKTRANDGNFDYSLIIIERLEDAIRILKDPRE